MTTRSQSHDRSCFLTALTPRLWARFFAMPQLTLAEQALARVMLSEKKPPIEIHDVLVARRKKSLAKQKPQRGKPARRFAKQRGKRTKALGPDLTTVRRFLRGKSHQVGVPETRGRKRIYSRRAVLARILPAMKHRCLSMQICLCRCDGNRVLFPIVSVCLCIVS